MYYDVGLRYAYIDLHQGQCVGDVHGRMQSYGVCYTTTTRLQRYARTLSPLNANIRMPIEYNWRGSWYGERFRVMRDLMRKYRYVKLCSQSSCIGFRLNNLHQPNIRND